MTDRIIKIDRTDGGTSIMRIINPDVVIADEIAKWEAGSGLTASGYSEVTESAADDIKAGFVPPEEQGPVADKVMMRDTVTGEINEVTLDNGQLNYNPTS